MFRVLLLPGSVLPADVAYSSLLYELGAGVEGLAKDLEVYAAAQPPKDYTLDTEVSGVLREADARKWDEFHLVGYSGGGAAALACAARISERLLSLGLLEPAWAGRWDMSRSERALWDEYELLEGLPPDQFMAAFVRLALKRGVEPPPAPPVPAPPWMAKRPAGIRAFLGTFKSYDLDRDALRRFERPVYFALGALSNPDHYLEIATRLRDVFSDYELEVFEKRHHFDPPHRIEPKRLAESLRVFWRRAESLSE